MTIEEDDVQRALIYWYTKASNEVKHFVKKETVEKIAIEKNGILFAKSRIMDGQRLIQAAEFSSDSVGREIGSRRKYVSSSPSPCRSCLCRCKPPPTALQRHLRHHYPGTICTAHPLGVQGLGLRGESARAQPTERAQPAEPAALTTSASIDAGEPELANLYRDKQIPKRPPHPVRDAKRGCPQNAHASESERSVPPRG